MESKFGRCIFCRDELTRAEKKGRGEHVIPEYLSGAICFKDVCSSCNSDLGKTADSPAKEESRIVAAAFELGLPELTSKIYDHGSGTFYDSEESVELNVKFRDGLPRITPQKFGEKLFVDSKDTISKLIEILKKNPPEGVAKEEVKKLVEDHSEIIENQEAEKKIELPKLEHTTKKRPGDIVFHPTITSEAAHRLVAKIGYEIMFYAMSGPRLSLYSDVMVHLMKVAFGVEEPRKAVFMYPRRPIAPSNRNGGAKHFHQIVIRYEDRATIIDIYFFGRVGFSLLLTGDSKEAYGPLDDEIVLLSLVNWFKSEEEKRKFIFFQTVDDDEPVCYEFTGLL